MRLRYLREQKEQLKQTKVSYKRAKYNLDDLYSDEDGDHLGGFTHGGRPLDNVDDFQDVIPMSSEDENDDVDKKMGKLNDEMVMNMNFGGGREAQWDENHTKSRKEVFEEIIAKSKAYKAAKFEVKEAAKDLTERLDNEYFDILKLLNLSKVKVASADDGVIDSYEQIAAKMKEQTRAVPAHVLMGDKEQARMRKQRLQAAHDLNQGVSESEEED